MRGSLLAVALVAACAHAVTPPVVTATAAAQRAWTCPTDRVATVEVAAAGHRAPPADIAHDDQRLAIWNNAEAAKAPHRDYLAYGCGRVGLLRCNDADNYVDGAGRPVRGWFCTVNEIGALRPDEEQARPSYQAAVHTLRDQLVARGDATGVQTVTPYLDAFAPPPTIAPPAPPPTGPPAPALRRRPPACRAPRWERRADA